MPGTLTNPIVLPSVDNDYINNLTGDLDNWFVWDTGYVPGGSQPGFNGNFVFFTTQWPTNFKTTLLVYACSNAPNNPVQMSDLTGVTPIHSGDFGKGYGYEYGALVAWNLPGNVQKYYFRVQSRDGVSTGNLSMTWRKYNPMSLGACGVCDPAQTMLCKVGTVSANVNTAGGDNGINQGGFGTFPSGTYELNMCPWQGQYPVQPPGTPGAGWYYLFTNDSYKNLAGIFPFGQGPATFPFGAIVGFFNYGPFFDTQFTGFSICTNLGGCGNPSYGPPASGWVVGGAELQITGENHPCFSHAFCHTGGTIGMAWISTIQNVNNYMSPNFQQPFALFNFDPATQISLAVASFANTGLIAGTTYGYSVTLNVKNTNINYSSGNFTLALNAGGDVGNPSGGQLLNLAAEQMVQVTFNFQSGSTDILRGTFSFLDCAGNPSVRTTTSVLAQAILSTAVIDHSLNCQSGFPPLSRGEMYFGFTNRGQVPISVIGATVTPNLVGGAIMTPPGTAAANLCTAPLNTTNWVNNSIVTNYAPGANLPFDLIAIARTSVGQPQRQSFNVVVTVGRVAQPLIVVNNFFLP